jgi:nitrogen fixation NifU-like protein
MKPDRPEDYAQQEGELDELYREVILDHYRSPRHRGSMASPTVKREGLNPLCGDEITIALKVEGGTITDIAFNGSGCSISQSSASMMTDAVMGKNIAEVGAVFHDFTAMMQGSDEVDPTELGDLESLTGVRKFPVRVKCATLAWHTLEEALGVLNTDGAAPEGDSDHPEPRA